MSSRVAILVLRRLRSDPLGVVGLLIVLAVTICAIVGQSSHHMIRLRSTSRSGFVPFSHWLVRR
ncbi:hypothetical protein [Mesorhizobium sp. C268A]|uniref:hypothetical protein n=1 Tax=Mesorhizobium sp. C268A TaxID=2956826 RepID=UPI00333B69A0